MRWLCSSGIIRSTCRSSRSNDPLDLFTEYNPSNFAFWMDKMKILRNSCLALAILAIGSMVGFVLAGSGFIALWWGFPGDWQLLKGLDGAPHELLALDAEHTTYLLRMVDGTLFTCQEFSCSPEQTDWSNQNNHCDDSTRPSTAALLPVIAVRGAQGVLACERSYTDIARTVYVTEVTGKGIYMSSGVSLIPTDAGVIGMGLVGAVCGFGLVVSIGLVFLVIRGINKRGMVEST